MPIPTEIILPPVQQLDQQGIAKYLQDLTYKLQENYRTIATELNGSIKADYLLQREQYTPELFGDSTEGSFTYVHAHGWVYRQGLLVDVWFDAEYSSTDATGKLMLSLPYKVARSEELPFIGSVHTSDFSYTSGSTISVIANPSTYNASFWCSGSGVSGARQDVPSSGRVIGHLRYLGVQNE